MPRLERLAGPTTTPEEVQSILDRDGAVIVEEAIGTQLLAGLNSDLDGFVDDLGVGLRNPVNDGMAEFYGSATVRFDGLAGKSSSFVELMQLPLLQGVADLVLKPHCEDYLLNTAQLIEIRPGETAQHIHRDEDALAAEFRVEEATLFRDVGAG